MKNICTQWKTLQSNVLKGFELHKIEKKKLIVYLKILYSNVSIWFSRQYNNLEGVGGGMLKI